MLVATLILAGLAALRTDFAAPPDAARLQAWWHWMDDAYTPETCRADLDALRDLGVKTAYVFVPGAYFPIDRFWQPMLSDGWLARFDAVLARAKENGMTLGFHNCPGWSSSGGPWIDYDHSMKVVVENHVDLSGGETAVTVPQSPSVVGGYHRDIALLAVQVPDDPEPLRVSRTFPTKLRVAEKGSSDATVFEFADSVPAFTTMVLDWADDCHHSTVDIEGSADGRSWTPLGHHHLRYYHTPLTPKPVGMEAPPAGTRFLRVTFRYVDAPEHVRHIDIGLKSISFSSVRLVDNLEEKAGLRGHGLAYHPPAPGAADLRGLDPSAVCDLSRFMDADGRVDLSAANLPPPAQGLRWRLLRIGYTSTGKKCSPATLRGLECDKLDRSGLDAHWPHMPARLAARPGAKDALRYCVIDSYEAGGQNWTADMPAKFRRLRGYDLMKYLPVMVGYVTGTVGESERFLYDLQRTISDLFVSEYYGHFAELCRRAGFVPVIEGYDGPYDPLEASAAADIPCGEFWVGGTGAGNARADKTPVWAASAAHLKGTSLVAAESFTTGAKEGRWQTTPEQLRVEGDRAWLHGVNQLVYHSYVAQPFANVKPGLSLAQHGTHLNRNTPWFAEGRAWSDYVARGQALLQCGTNHAEVLVLSGDSNAYLCMGPPKGLVEAGLNFDWIPARALGRLVVADGGRIGMPGLPPYELLDLGEDRYLTVATLREIRRLKAAGARLRARRPLGTPSLADDPSDWKRLVADVFASGDLTAPMPRPFADSRGRLKVRRRDAAGAVIYYLLNDSDAAFDGDVSFAVKTDGAARPFAAAELWKAEDGSIAALAATPEGERLSVRMKLAAHRSAFVVLSKDGVDGSRSQSVTSGKDSASPLMDLSTDWQVTFEGLAAPEPKAFAKLQSWSESDDPKLRYFSGRARYSRNVALHCPTPTLLSNSSVHLSLGEVHDVVNVFIDGRKIATLWESPYEVEFTPPGTSFELVVEVVNNWPNRMIGDAIVRRANPAAEKKAPVSSWFPPAAAAVFSTPVACYPTWVVEDRPDSGTGICTWSNYDTAWSADEPLKPAGLIGPVAIRRLERVSETKEQGGR